MHEECKECLHGDKCPAANDENGECHGKWIFKSKSEAKKPEAVLSNSTGGLADTGFIDIWVRITDPETVENYKDVDKTIILEDMQNGSLVDMCEIIDSQHVGS